MIYISLDIGYDQYAVGHNIDAYFCIIIATEAVKTMLFVMAKTIPPTATIPPQPYTLIRATIHPQGCTNDHTLSSQLFE